MVAETASNFSEVDTHLYIQANQVAAIKSVCQGDQEKWWPACCRLPETSDIQTSYCETDSPCLAAYARQITQVVLSYAAPSNG